jgi:hypothetical protein
MHDAAEERTPSISCFGMDKKQQRLGAKSPFEIAISNAKRDPVTLKLLDDAVESRGVTFQDPNCKF